ncbi:hypothetical protein GCM10022419_008090 [Nonomuraea rosea]|uniref:Uncharacterized protein n=1 Tax=Nonomuraea rosea TaxID=638574 RepID=A0ABP6V999_9ACTN
MTEPAPLGPTRDDPAVQAAAATQDPYVARLDAIRNDPALSELAKAEQVAEAYDQQMKALTEHATDLHNRRIARLEHLQGSVPTGPGIPTDASQADKAVLSASFRAALDQARAADFDQRRAILADALKFGDDTTLRALLTAAHENSDTKLVDVWADATGNTPVIAEIRDLHTQMHGIHAGSSWQSKAFNAPKRPGEIPNIPILRQRAEQQQRDDARARQYSGINRY